MNRLAFCLLLTSFCLATTLGFSQPPVNVLAPVNQDEPPPPPEFKTLKIFPQGEPKPALQYRLDPEIRNQEAGNALTTYYRAFSPEWMSYRYRDKDLWKKEEEWQNMPLEKLPREADMRSYAFLKEIDLGTNRAYIDWEMVSKAKKDGAWLLIPDVQSMREFARLLSTRTRYELKEKDYPAAVKSLRSLITLGRHCAKGPTLIQGLVGIAITTIGFGRLEEAIQQPGFPNLYWALAALPNTPIDLREGMDGEKIMIDNIFPGLRDMLYSKNLRPMGQPELEALVEGFRKLQGLDGNLQPKSDWENLFSKSAMSLMMAAAHAPAKEKLIKFGVDAKQLDALPGLQVVILGEILVYDEHFDSVVKWLNVPYFQARPDLDRLEKELIPNPTGIGFAGAPIGFLSRLLIPATTKVLIAKLRTERQLALLKTVEAIRMYAAKDGKLPKSLDEIKNVPIPLDPVSGKAFKYYAEGKTAMLESQSYGITDRKEFYRYKLELQQP